MRNYNCDMIGRTYLVCLREIFFLFEEKPNVDAAVTTAAPNMSDAGEFASENNVAPNPATSNDPISEFNGLPQRNNVSLDFLRRRMLFFLSSPRVFLS